MVNFVTPNGQENENFVNNFMTYGRQNVELPLSQKKFYKIIITKKLL